MEREEGMVMGNAKEDVRWSSWNDEIGEGLLLPDTSLTKICIVSMRSGDAEREFEGEECIVCGGEVGLVFERIG